MLDITTPININRSSFFKKREQHKAQYLALSCAHFARSDTAMMLGPVNIITSLITKCCTNLSLTSRQRSLRRPNYKQG